jgi:uncharacterized protein
MVSSPQHEPTMEEILASIRKIISEDSTEQQPAPAEAKPAPAAPPSPPVEAAPDSDVLELTQELPEEAPAPVMAAPEPIRPVAPPPPENDVVFEPIEPEPAPAPTHSSDGIFSDKTRRAVDDAFASIEPEAEEDSRAYSSVPAPVDGLSVEAVFERAVREAFDPVVRQWLGDNADAIVERMKPLIREWMDEHFPALLEGAVRDEVARVARARGSKR